MGTAIKKRKKNAPFLSHLPILNNVYERIKYTNGFESEITRRILHLFTIIIRGFMSETEISPRLNNPHGS